MAELNFEITGVEPERFAAAPLLRFKLRVGEATPAGEPPTPVHGALLRCQIRIEPARRRYSATEQAKLLDLFGRPERWGQTLRPFAWAQVSTALPRFTGAGTFDLPVPCSYDFELAATKYFDALENGEIPLCFLFSGTVFYEAADGGMQVAPIAWEKEAYYRLPAATWQTLMELYYPNRAWLGLRKDVFDRLLQYKTRHGLPSWEKTLESLLAGERELALLPSPPSRGARGEEWIKPWTAPS